MVLPGGDSLNRSLGETTRGGFAQAVLRGIGAPVTDMNMQSMLAWMTGENTRAAFNPLATTRKGFAGATEFNTAGVKNFKDFEQGVAATIETLNLSYYTDVVSALQRGTTG